MPPPIAIALSGGVDSLVAGALLKQSGREVVGFHFLTGFEPETTAAEQAEHRPGLPAEPTDAAAGVRSVAEQLDIPLQVVDLRSDFQRCVVDYFTRSYHSGQTPNPCLVCNPTIKFGMLFEAARQHGAGAMATGHYARITQDSDGRRRLLRGVDPAKDQSYFLSRLSQSQLARAAFPLGEMTKDRTRQFAAAKDLVPSTTQESQDICFIKQADCGEFLRTRPGFTAAPGPIVNLKGETIGRHHGLHRFTVGQRRGINCPAAQPYYVVRLDAAENRLVVGSKQDLLSQRCRVADINWIAGTPSPARDVRVRVRYRHSPVPARLIPEQGDRARIEFEQPQSAVTPGQGAVFYDGDEVLGGGWIQ